MGITLPLDNGVFLLVLIRESETVGFLETTKSLKVASLPDTNKE
jgi:hypothetical protein